MPLPFMMAATAAGVGGHMLGLGAQTVGPGQAQVLGGMNTLQAQYGGMAQTQTGVITPLMTLMGMAGPFTAPGMAPDTMRQLDYNRQMQELRNRARYQMSNQFTFSNITRSALSVIGLDALVEPVLGRFDYAHRMRTEGALRMANVMDNAVTTTGFVRAGGGVGGGIDTADYFMRQIMQQTIRRPLGGLLGQVANVGRADTRQMVDVARMLAERGEFATVTAGLSTEGGPGEAGRRGAEVMARRTMLAEARTKDIGRIFGTKDRGASMDLLREIMGMTREIEEIDPVAMENAASKISAFAKTAGKSMGQIVELMQQGSKMAESLGVEGMAGGRIMARAAATTQEMVGRGVVSRADIAGVGGMDRAVALRADVLMRLSRTRPARDLMLARFGGMADIAGIREDEFQPRGGGVEERRLQDRIEQGFRPILDPSRLTEMMVRRSQEFFDPAKIEERRRRVIELANKQNQERVSAERSRETSFLENIGNVVTGGFLADAVGLTDALQQDPTKDKRNYFRMAKDALGGIFGFGAEFESKEIRDARVTDAQKFMSHIGDKGTRDMIVMGHYIGGSRRRMKIFNDMYGHILAEKDPDGADRAAGVVLRGLSARAQRFSENRIDQIDYFRRMLSRQVGREVSVREANVLFKESLKDRVVDESLGRRIREEHIVASTESEMTKAFEDIGDIRKEIIREGIKEGKGYADIQAEVNKVQKHADALRNQHTESIKQRRLEREREEAKEAIVASGSLEAGVRAEKKRFDEDVGTAMAYRDRLNERSREGTKEKSEESVKGALVEGVLAQAEGRRRERPSTEKAASRVDRIVRIAEKRAETPAEPEDDDEGMSQARARRAAYEERSIKALQELKEELKKNREEQKLVFFMSWDQTQPSNMNVGTQRPGGIGG